MYVIDDTWIVVYASLLNLVLMDIYRDIKTQYDIYGGGGGGKKLIASL